MKIVQSLLAIIQLLAICQFIFGVIVVPALYESQTRNIVAQVANQDALLASLNDGHDPGVRYRVKNWHQSVISPTRNWCMISGVIFFSLSTVAQLRLRRYVFPNSTVV